MQNRVFTERERETVKENHSRLEQQGKKPQKTLEPAIGMGYCTNIWPLLCI